MSEGVDWINKKLIEVYGRDIGCDLPKFRIVFSSSQYEKRYGEFEIYSSDGNIYLRTEKGVEEVPKYLPHYPDLWVLEQLQPTDGNPYLEMVAKLSYEPVWIFGVGNSNRQPIWRAVRLLVENRLYGDPNKKYLSPSELVDIEEKQIAAERIRGKEFLQNETPALAYSLKHGESVVVPNKEFKKDVIDAS